MEQTQGYYQDKFGNLKPDRRTGSDRRGTKASASGRDHERRKMFRRKADRELLDLDHKTAIEEALEDFAEEHNGHL